MSFALRAIPRRQSDPGGAQLVARLPVATAYSYVLTPFSRNANSRAARDDVLGVEVI